MTWVVVPPVPAVGAAAPPLPIGATFDGGRFGFQAGITLR
jgi:hypothetical protein